MLDCFLMKTGDFFLLPFSPTFTIKIQKWTFVFWNHPAQIFWCFGYFDGRRALSVKLCCKCLCCEEQSARTGSRARALLLLPEEFSLTGKKLTPGRSSLGALPFVTWCWCQTLALWGEGEKVTAGCWGNEPWRPAWQDNQEGGLDSFPVLCLYLGEENLQQSLNSHFT